MIAQQRATQAMEHHTGALQAEALEFREVEMHKQNVMAGEVAQSQQTSVHLQSQLYLSGQKFRCLLWIRKIFSTSNSSYLRNRNVIIKRKIIILYYYYIFSLIRRRFVTRNVKNNQSEVRGKNQEVINVNL